MKKKWLYVTAGIAVVCILLCLAYPSLVQRRNKNRAAEWMEIRLPAHEDMIYLDDHGGFHGDGETVMILTFSEKADVKLRKRMEESPVWRPFPVTMNLRRCIYGSEELAITYLSRVHQAKFPEITNGYWFFLDRQADDEDPGRYQDENVLSRPSINCVAALYDTDTRTLYYWKFDT